MAATPIAALGCPRLQVRGEGGLDAYHAALDACSKAGQWQVACSLLEGMDIAGLVPRTRTYNVVIGACAMARAWRPALQLLDEMDACGVPRDVISYGTAVAACERGRNWQVPRATLRLPPRFPHRASPTCHVHGAHHRNSAPAVASYRGRCGSTVA